MDLRKQLSSKTRKFLFLSLKDQLLLDMEFLSYTGRISPLIIKRVAKKYKIPYKIALLYVNNKIDSYKRNRENIDFINRTNMREIYDRIKEIGLKYTSFRLTAELNESKVDNLIKDRNIIDKAADRLIKDGNNLDKTADNLIKDGSLENKVTADLIKDGNIIDKADENEANKLIENRRNFKKPKPE